MTQGRRAGVVSVLHWYLLRFLLAVTQRMMLPFFLRRVLFHGVLSLVPPLPFLPCVSSRPALIAQGTGPVFSTVVVESNIQRLY